MLVEVTRSGRVGADAEVLASSEELLLLEQERIC